MEGRAAAPGAGTVVNALATGRGSAFALDFETTATVRLDPDAATVSGTIAGAPDGDTTLIERCVERVVDRYGTDEGGVVETTSEVPTAAGLKSSSAAANAAVVAALSALGLEVANDPDADVTKTEACRVGVRAAREAGVTVTGAFDDASASMLGGVTVTDNTEDELLARDDPFAEHALVWTPPERAYSADADASACEQVAPMAELATDLALDGDYARAMTVNGLAFSAALGFSAEPAVAAMAHCDGVSLSGTGPSVVAVGDRSDLAVVEEQWADRDGATRLVETRKRGARVL
ncbi:shikimate kinase [Halobaculum marinum]|uniref:Shikimate kinase n=1 Tax=Halobaculum marinum TaxID=3031996 RepID=A0ABD5WRL8_9EURY|nr:shikimate kinase [Halobaculum sp. DT55]